MIEQLLIDCAARGWNIYIQPGFASWMLVRITDRNSDDETEQTFQGASLVPLKLLECYNVMLKR